jgi:hypothetical protein
VQSCIGKRSTRLSGNEEEIDRAFWGSEQHRTWEESESDSDVSYDMDEEDDEEEELESEMDQEESEDESEDEPEEEDEGENDSRQKKRMRFNAYRAPTPAGATGRKTVVTRREKVTPTPRSTSEPKDLPSERRETRESTKARTQEVQSRPKSQVTKKKGPTTPTGTSLKPTQEQLMEEAKVVEEWNKADYDAYIRFTELSEKERAAFLQKRKPRGSKTAYSIVSRSFIESGTVRNEIRIIPPVTDASLVPRKKEKALRLETSLRSASDVLGINSEVPPIPSKQFRYRYPYGSMQPFNTVEEFQSIHQSAVHKDEKDGSDFISFLHSLLEMK